MRHGGLQCRHIVHEGMGHFAGKILGRYGLCNGSLLIGDSDNNIFLLLPCRIPRAQPIGNGFAESLHAILRHGGGQHNGLWCRR
jgi:hypothetical protein